MTRRPPSPPTPLPWGRGEPRACRSAPLAVNAVLCRGWDAPSPQGERGLGVRGITRASCADVTDLFTMARHSRRHGSQVTADKESPHPSTMGDCARRGALASLEEPKAWRVEIPPQGAGGVACGGFPVPCGAAGCGSHRARAASGRSGESRCRAGRHGFWRSAPVPRGGGNRPARHLVTYRTGGPATGIGRPLASGSAAA